MHALEVERRLESSVITTKRDKHEGIAPNFMGARRLCHERKQNGKCKVQVSRVVPDQNKLFFEEMILRSSIFVRKVGHGRRV